jgi:hypothetical protein
LLLCAAFRLPDSAAVLSKWQAYPRRW